MINPKEEPSDDEQLKIFLRDFDSKIMVADGLSYAFLGVANTHKNGYVAVYSTQAIISHLMKEDMMDFETAEEFMKYNIIGSYVGKKTPIFVDIVPDIFWKD